MAVGDIENMRQRLRSVLPPWFPDLSNAPILTALLTGLADAFSFIYSYLQYAKLQTRIKTATGAWLDLISWDFFGANFRRRSGEADEVFKPRLLKEITRPRNTRQAVIDSLTDLTGVSPVLVEPFHTGDCGAYGVGTLAYGLAGCYGSTDLPNQIFVTAVRPLGVGIANIGGYGTGALAYGVAGSYVSQSQITGPITDAEIYENVKQTISAGVTAWVDIVSSLPAPPDYSQITLDANSPTFDGNSTTMDHW